MNAYARLLVALLFSVTFAAAQDVRVVAGESRIVETRGAARSATITPTLDIPILVERADAGKLRFRIPPATPVGDYIINVDGETFTVTVDAATMAVPAVAGRIPVVLLNGFQVVCNKSGSDSTLDRSIDWFGQLASLLQSDGASVTFFNNCAYGTIPIEQIATQFGNYLAALKYADGTPVTQVDVVAHSMGGLVVRAYLAGKGTASGIFSPPGNHKIRKLVAVAVPHFGSFVANYQGAQESQMVPGSQFLWDLATWNQSHDDLRGVDAIGIAGNAGSYFDVNNTSDGVVSLTSAALTFTSSDQRTRIVPYCHQSPGFFNSFVMMCFLHQGIADINNALHPTARIVRSFLTDTTEWQTIGTPPSQDPFLMSYGGVFLTLKASNDVYVTDLTSVPIDSGSGTLVSGPSSAISSLYYTEFVPAGAHTFTLNHASGQPTTASTTVSAGIVRTVPVKSGPSIQSVQSTGALPGLTLASGANIVINGAGFGVSASLTANGTALSVSKFGDDQITAFLPASYSGLVKLTVTNFSGQHSVNVMTAPPAITATPAISSGGIVNNASYATASAPGSISPGSIVAIFGANLTDGTTCVAPTCGPTFGANGKLGATLAGAQVSVNGIAAPVFYALSSQLGVQIPSETTGTQAAVQVTVNGNTSVAQNVNLASVAPGIFTFTSDGKGAGAITHADGSAVSPAKPASRGENVTLYATGLGATSPAVATGTLPSVTASTVAATTLLIGGVTATPSFAGLSGCCVALNQVNFQIPASAPTGAAVALALTIGGATSNSVTIAIQ